MPAPPITRWGTVRLGVPTSHRGDDARSPGGPRVAPVRVALPFQTVETVNESAQQRQRTLDLIGTGRDPEWRNRLIWGDRKYVLPALLNEFAGKVDLINTWGPLAYMGVRSPN